MNVARLNKIFEHLAAANPIPASELEYINPYTFLVAVVLSAQATDVGVNKATAKLFQVVTTPEEMVALGEQELKSYIKTINYFNNKAKNIIGLSNALIERFNSQVPSSLKDLVSLPGVGLKSAHVVLNCVFSQPLIAVDTHVFRVARRIGLTPSTTAHKVSEDLAKIIPDQWKMNAGHWLVLHGRYTCKARKPLCEKCTISEFCDYYKLTSCCPSS